MKKYTYNTFLKGINLDLHPLTVPNDTLTDALNATILTMNGNEGILQNDMGNGRVESAFLPSGYVPVGIKEHGGIIYVASYNPLTNKGLIGSFPSPERNYNLEELTNKQIELELLNKPYTKSFNNFDNITGLWQLENKVQILDLPIRSGDKFAICFNSNDRNNGDNLKYISFTERNLVNLYIQVLDANNNLRDITDLLKIVDNPSIEGDKYFIANVLPPTEGASVDEIRNIYANYLNTYNNKLFGKLFLVGKVNVVDHIDAYVEVNINENNKWQLTWTVTYYYKCPQKYIDFPLIDIKFGSSRIINPKLVSTSTEKQYNEEFYSTTFTATYEASSYDGIMYYRIIPKMKDVPGNYRVSKYLPHIAIEGTVNLALIGTGLIDINRWNYKYLGDLLTLNYGFDIDISGKYKFSDLVFECENALDSSDKVTINIPPKFKYSGVFTEVFSELDLGEIYIVTPKIKRNENTPLTLSKRIIITTNIYNDLFQEILDYGDVNNAETLKAIQLHNKLIFTNKTKVNLNINSHKTSDLAYKTNEDSEQPLESTLNYFSRDLDPNSYTLYRNNEYSIKEELNLDLTLDPEKYPFKSVTFKDTIPTITIKPSIGNFILTTSNKELQDTIYEYEGNLCISKKIEFKLTQTKKDYTVILYKSIVENFKLLLQDLPFICPVIASWSGLNKGTINLLGVSTFNQDLNSIKKQNIYTNNNINRSVYVHLTDDTTFMNSIKSMLYNQNKPFIFTSLDCIHNIFHNLINVGGDTKSKNYFLQDLLQEYVSSHVNTKLFKKSDIYNENQVPNDINTDTTTDENSMWYYIFLIDSNNNPVILNICYRGETDLPPYDNIQDMLINLLGDLCNIYYKSELEKVESLYSQESIYREDTSYEELYLTNIINNLLVDTIDNKSIDDNNTLIFKNTGVSSKLLTFLVLTDNILINSNTVFPEVTGFDNFDEMLPIGLIDADSDLYCLNDNDGNPLTKRFYYFNLKLDSTKYINFTNKLDIVDGNIIVKQSAQNKLLDYHFAAGTESNDIYIVANNGAFRVLDINQDDVYSQNRVKLMNLE